MFFVHMWYTLPHNAVKSQKQQNLQFSLCGTVYHICKSGLAKFGRWWNLCCSCHVENYGSSAVCRSRFFFKSLAVWWNEDSTTSIGFRTQKKQKETLPGSSFSHVLWETFHWYEYYRESTVPGFNRISTRPITKSLMNNKIYPGWHCYIVMSYEHE